MVIEKMSNVVYTQPLKMIYYCSACKERHVENDHLETCRSLNGIHKKFHDLINTVLVSLMYPKFHARICKSESKEFNTASLMAPDIITDDG